MAVVQISRIQVRRGKKGQTNLPQLASGELGWAVDSQELYIGNGSVSEGAPQVGILKFLQQQITFLTLRINTNTDLKILSFKQVLLQELQ